MKSTYLLFCIGLVLLKNVLTDDASTEASPQPETESDAFTPTGITSPPPVGSGNSSLASNDTAGNVNGTELIGDTDMENPSPSPISPPGTSPSPDAPNTTITPVVTTAPTTPVFNGNNSTTPNITVVDLFENQTNSSDTYPGIVDACTTDCIDVNKSVVLAVSLSVLGGVILLGILSYGFVWYRRARRPRGDSRTGKAKGYTQVPPNENIYMETLEVPKPLGVEKV